MERLNKTSLRVHKKPLTRPEQAFIKSHLTEHQIKKIDTKLQFYSTFDVSVRIKGLGDFVLEFNGEGLDSIDCTVMTLEDWRNLYGREPNERP